MVGEKSQHNRIVICEGLFYLVWVWQTTTTALDNSLYVNPRDNMGTYAAGRQNGHLPPPSNLKFERVIDDTVLLSYTKCLKMFARSVYPRGGLKRQKRK